MGLVQKELQNAYIGEYTGWHPGENTIAWYKLETNANDYSGNNRDMTENSMTYGNTGDLKYATFNGSSNKSASYSSFPQFSELFINCWIYLSGGSSRFVWSRGMDGGGSASNGYCCYISPGGEIVYCEKGIYYSTGITLTGGVWHNVARGRSGNNLYLWVDGQLSTTVNIGYTLINSTWDFMIGRSGYNSYQYPYNGYINNFIMEDTCWTNSAVAEYYDKNKGIYGIS